MAFGKRAGNSEEYKVVMRLFREKIRRAKALQELNLATATKDNKRVSIHTFTTKGRLRRISIIYLMQGRNVV